MKLRFLPQPAILSSAALLLPALAVLARAEEQTQAPQQPSDANRLRRAAPPLMIDVEAGYVIVGTKTERLRELLDGKWGNQVKMDLGSQNPGERVRVDGFQIAATEVTNRQYLEFVNATGHPVPLGWAAPKLLEVARLQWEAEQETKKNADPKHQVREFEPVSWWRTHYREHPWGIPAGEEDHPVTFVSYRDAQDFCIWAGLRLPSEAEWMRACRGETDHEYISGDKFDATASLNYETSGTRLKPVTWIAAAKTESGIFDLPGSVYEWTTSPYSSLKGYKAMKSGESKGDQEEIDPKFDGDARVVKGGSFRVENPRFSTRVAHRVKAPNYAVSPMIGFRLVRTPSLGFDRMSIVMDREIDSTMLDGSLNIARTIGEESWQCTIVGGLKNLEGYEIISRPEFTLFTPRAEVRETSASKFHAASQKEPVTLGVLSSSDALPSLGLPAGSYVVKYRGAGKIEKPKEKEKEKKSPLSHIPQDPAGKKKKLSKKEQEKLDQEEAKKKAEAGQDPPAEGEAKPGEKPEEGSSFTGEKETEEIKLAEDIEWDPMKENLLFYHSGTGAIVATIASSTSPIDFPSVKNESEVKNLMEEVAADEKAKKPAVRRFHLAMPTSSSRTWMTFHFDLSPRE